jgi:hypothetical protein
MALSISASWALTFYIIGHRLVEKSQGGPFVPPSFIFGGWRFVALIAAIQISTFFLVWALIGQYERNFRKLIKKKDFLEELGWHAFKYSFILAAIEFIFVSLLTIMDTTLLNVWDVLFILVFIGIFYIGCDFYFYYSVPLTLWKNSDPDIELEKMKMEYDHQKMYLKAFVWITFSILVSQVFVILKGRFEPYLSDPAKYSHLVPAMVINSLQICFLILVIWGTVFTVILGRIEEIKINLSRLKKKDNWKKLGH